MGTHDERIDAYIERAAPFARPLLMQLRRDLHAASSTIDESIRWGMPAFLHNGKLVAIVAAFRAHASLAFWKPGSDRASAEGMGQFGRLTQLSDLPDAATISSGVHEAIARIDSKVPTAPRRTSRPEAIVPEDLRAALEVVPAAATAFARFPPGQRREYVDWVTEARREETRRRRIAQAVEWCAQGKTRNWKHLAR